jgi:hypothetical protein
MRTFAIVVLLSLTNVVAMGQSSSPGSPSEANREQVPPAAEGTVKAAPPQPSLKATLAAAHEKLEHGDPQEAIAMLQKLTETSGASAKGVQHELGIAYYRTGNCCPPNRRLRALSTKIRKTWDTSPTIYPAVAAWDGTFHLSRESEMLNRWASQEFSTDWGTRDLSPAVSFYDPISYHQGSVWPLFTGWVSLSEYRNGRSLAGYAHLMQNAGLTWVEDLGAVTEILSGEFFRWFGRSTWHQLWSSAMVVTPIVRGMFGLEWSASEDTLTVTPSLPAQWSEAKIVGVPLGQSRVSVEVRRKGSALSLRPAGDGSKAIHLRSRAGGTRIETGELRIPLPAAEVGIAHCLPEAGAITSQMKVLDQQESQHALQLRLSAPADSDQNLFLRLNDPNIHLRTDGAEVSANFSQLQIHFPPGAGC